MMRISILFIILFFSIIFLFHYSKKDIHQDVVVIRNGNSLSQVLVHFTIIGKHYKYYWWRDSSITGDWRSLEKKINFQEKYVLTNEDGKVFVKGKGVNLRIDVYLEDGVYELIDTDLSIVSKIPKVLYVDKENYLGPVFNGEEIKFIMKEKKFDWSANNVYRENTEYFKNMFETNIMKKDILFLKINRWDEDKRELERGIPYEIIAEEDKKLIIYNTYIIDDGILMNFVPKGQTYTVKILPEQKEEKIPGLDIPERPLPYKNKTITGIKPTNDINNPVMTIKLEPLEK